MPQQVPRLLAVFALAALGLILARRLLVPETFGDIGFYRAAAIDSVVAHEKKYAGHQECSLCHNQIQQSRRAGNHRGVACENCHGPGMEHLASPLDVKPMVPADREFCTACHGYNASRPTGFPQIDAETHNPRMVCTACHDAHAPEPPTTPNDCSACHGQIARQKTVSHHADVDCTACHSAPEEHRANPRSVRATKPTERAFCGVCHQQEGLEHIPQINLQTHNPAYRCWDCHYPHYPEAG